MGGTFDPPHCAHLAAAAAARHDLSLDEVWFVPAGVPPHKRRKSMTPSRIRLALLRSALRGLEGFRALALEIRRPGPSYTVDTLERLRDRYPDTDWWLVVGTDMLADLPSWRRPGRVLDLAGIAAVPRPGFAARWPRGLPRGRFHVVDAPALDLSSSDLRARVARGASIRFLVPAAVERTVRRHRLYASPGPERAARPAAARAGRHARMARA
jgi:nicotinate-nucleotide adenylyltransferase